MLKLFVEASLKPLFVNLLALVADSADWPLLAESPGHGINCIVLGPCGYAFARFPLFQPILILRKSAISEADSWVHGSEGSTWRTLFRSAMSKSKE
jgi:hypothetical protein